MDKLKLVEPTAEYEDQVMACREAFLQSGDGFDGCAGLEDTDSYGAWLDFEGRLTQKYGAGHTPSTVYLAVREADNRLVGIIDLRHRLSEFLLRYGGHIGYSVAPWERGKGYAGEMLRLVLEKARARGLDRVLVTCDRDNPASAKSILRCGGVLENEVPDEPGLGRCGVIQRYWIEL